jgi:hypothetical protein
MANSTTNINQLTVNQSQKEVTVNAYFDAASPATHWGRNAATTGGLTWGYYGGVIIYNGVPTFVANGTLALTASANNFIELDPTTGTVYSSSSFTAGRVRLYTVVTGASTVTNYTDHRSFAYPQYNGAASVSVAGGVDVQLGNAAANCNFIKLTGAITANIVVYVPNRPWQYTVFNNTSGAFTVTFSTLSGAGVVVGQGLKAMLQSDGLDMLRLTADI